VRYTRPRCGDEFDSAALQRPARGRMYCPACQERVVVSFPHGAAVAVASILISAGALALAHVRNVIGFIVGPVLIGVPISASLRFGPPV
jgi:hypothetical protein